MSTLKGSKISEVKAFKSNLKTSIGTPIENSGLVLILCVEGCACLGTIFSGYFFKQLKEKKIQKLLMIATGALMNSTSSQQGESIPGIAHAVSIEN